MDIQVIDTNSFGINRGIYAAKFLNSLPDSTANALIASGDAVLINYGTESNDTVQPGEVLATLPNGQPVGITRPCKAKGKKVTGFASTDGWIVQTTGTWNGIAGTHYNMTEDVTLMSNTTGLAIAPGPCPDGTQLLKKIDILTDAKVGIYKWPNPGPIASLNGLIGIWIWVGKPTSGSPIINIALGTGGFPGENNYGFNNNSLFVNQWNFLVIARNADPVSTSDKEAHPYGLSEDIYTALNSRWVSQPLTTFQIFFENMLGGTVYLASAMTGWDTKAQFVLGGDSSGPYTRDIVLPKFKQHGLKGYIAETFRIGGADVTDWGAYGSTQYLDECYAAGWDIINHTVNHSNPASAYPTDAAKARFEVAAAKSWLLSLGYTRGSEFYASPQSGTSTIVSTVTKNEGFKLQRHGTHDGNQVTPYGVMNPEHIGSVDLGGNSWIYAGIAPYTQINLHWSHINNYKIWVDMIIKYKATGFPFWHVVQVSGDNGFGTALPPSATTMYKSTFELLIDYIASKAAQGLCTVPDGFTGFYYGSGK